VPLIVFAIQLGQAWCLAQLLVLLLRNPATRSGTRTHLEGLPMGYKNPLLRIDLADKLDAEEYDGLWLVLRNPKLQPQSRLAPPEKPLGPDGKPSTEDAMAGMTEVVARLIFDWNLPDPLDPAGEDAEAMPIQHRGDHLAQGPAVEDVAKIPAAVTMLVGTLVGQAVNPQ
jgi:hypothetical protein